MIDHEPVFAGVGPTLSGTEYVPPLMKSLDSIVGASHDPIEKITFTPE